MAAMASGGEWLPWGGAGGVADGCHPGRNRLVTLNFKFVVER